MGGAISMVSKNWKLFVARLSNFWLRKILLDRPKKKIFPTKTKKWREQMGRTPYLKVVRKQLFGGVSNNVQAAQAT